MEHLDDNGMASKSQTDFLSVDNLNKESEATLPSSGVSTAPTVIVQEGFTTSSIRKTRPSSASILESTLLNSPPVKNVTSSLSQPNLRYEGEVDTEAGDLSSRSVPCSITFDDTEGNDVLQVTNSSAILDFMFETNNRDQKTEQELTKDEQEHFLSESLPSNSNNNSGGGSGRSPVPVDYGYELLETIINHVEEEILGIDDVSKESEATLSLSAVSTAPAPAVIEEDTFMTSRKSRPSSASILDSTSFNGPPVKNVISSLSQPNLRYGGEVSTETGDLSSRSPPCSKTYLDDTEANENLLSNSLPPKSNSGGGSGRSSVLVDYELQEIIVNHAEEEIMGRDVLFDQPNFNSEKTTLVENYGDLQCVLTEIKEESEEECERTLEINGNQICVSKYSVAFLKNEIEALHENQKNAQEILEHLHNVISQLEENTEEIVPVLEESPSEVPFLENETDDVSRRSSSCFTDNIEPDLRMGNTLSAVSTESSGLYNSAKKFQKDECNQFGDIFKEPLEIQYCEILDQQQHTFNELGYSSVSRQPLCSDTEGSVDFCQEKLRSSNYSSILENATHCFEHPKITILEQLENSSSDNLISGSEYQDKVKEWLDQIPSSPEPPISDIDDREDLIRIHVNQRSAVSNLTAQANSSNDNLKSLALGFKPVTFTSIPAPKMTSSELSSILEIADSKMSEVNRKIASNSFFEPTPFISANAVWRSDRVKKAKDKASTVWSAPRKLMSWFVTLSIFHWFSKKPDQPEKTDAPSEKPIPSSANSLKEDVNVTFTPYQSTLTMDGQLVSSKVLFGGDTVEEQVKSALDTINVKLNMANTGQTLNLNQGFSDGEAFPYLDEKPSIDEIELLTDLIKNKETSKDSKMRSIFGIREYNRIKNTAFRDLHRASQPQQYPRATRRSVWQRILGLIIPSYQQARYNTRFRRRRHYRRRQHPTVEDEHIHQLNQQLYNLPSANPQQALPLINPESNSVVRNLMRNVSTGLMAFFGFSRNRRVAPEPQPEQVQQPNPINTRRRLPYHSSNRGELRQVLLNQGAITRRAPNPLRLRLAREALSEDLIMGQHIQKPENSPALSKPSSSTLSEKHEDPLRSEVL